MKKKSEEVTDQVKGNFVLPAFTMDQRLNGKWAVYKIMIDPDNNLALSEVTVVFESSDKNEAREKYMVHSGEVMR